MELFMSILPLILPWERPTAHIPKAGELSSTQYILSGIYSILGTVLGTKGKQVNQIDHPYLHRAFSLVGGK